MGTSRLAALALLGLFLGTPGRAPAAGTPDPSEEMTPEELATLPEPVPAALAGQGMSRAGGTAPTAPGASGDALWRVQVFSTQDPDLADRIAREAAQLLGAKAYVAHEAAQYKVRLGDYGSEGEALELKSRAVRSGYPGAFRIRCPNPTLNKE